MMTTQKIHIIDGKKEYFISLDDFIFAQADGNYCAICLRNAQYKTVRILLGELWNMIGEACDTDIIGIKRIGRSHIINLNSVMGVDPKNSILTVRTPQGSAKLKIAKAAIKGIKEKQSTVLLEDFSVKKRLTCSLNELNTSHPEFNGFEYVDLGLPSGLLWATRNVREDDLRPVPDYYGWGELYLCDGYNQKEHIHSNQAESPADPKTHILKADYDVARKLWGKEWQVPSVADFIELFDNCYRVWCTTEDYLQKGCLFIGKNGNKVFLPADGYQKGYDIFDNNVVANYWTRNESEEDGRALSVMLKEVEYEKLNVVVGDVCEKEMYLGLSIRPVISSEAVLKENEKRPTAIIVEPLCEDAKDFVLKDNIYRDDMEGWNLFSLSLPVDLTAAQDYLKQVCGQLHPDIIVGYQSACLVCKNLSDYPRILVCPGQDEWDDDDSFVFDDQDFGSNALVSGKCCVVAHDPDSVPEEYCDCEIAEYPSLSDPYEDFRRFYLFPLIREFYRDNLKKTPYRHKLMDNVGWTESEY